jgi:hypothetical protein
MNLDGKPVGQSQAPLDVTDEEVLNWYRNMVTGEFRVLDIILP